MIRAVLFDAGGTLLGLRGSVGSVYASVAARYGVTVEAPTIDQRFRTAFAKMPALAFPDVPEAELPQREYDWWKALVAAVFSDIEVADFDGFFADLFEHFAQSEAWELFPDTEPTLTALRRRGLRLAIVSNFDGRLTRICEGLGIARHFETIVMSGRAGAAKPDPRIFTVALEALGVTPAEAVHVGDSESEDLAGAQACGLRGILIDRAARVRGVDRVSDMRELLEIDLTK